MAGMNNTYLNAIGDHGASLIDYIALVNSEGTVISDYKAAAWDGATTGDIYLTSDITYSISADTTVAGWRGFDDGTGTTEYGGKDFDTAETFSNAGDFVLDSNETYIEHNAPSE